MDPYKIMPIPVMMVIWVSGNVIEQSVRINASFAVECAAKSFYI